LGLDQNKFNECFSNGKYLSAIKEQMAEAKSLGISGTPTSFINGNIYPGAYPFEDFADSSGKLEKGLKSLIEDLLK
jgi:protein-disulfide isomerase